MQHQNERDGPLVFTELEERPPLHIEMLQFHLRVGLSVFVLAEHLLQRLGLGEQRLLRRQLVQADADHAEGDAVIEGARIVLAEMMRLDIVHEDVEKMESGGDQVLLVRARHRTGVRLPIMVDRVIDIDEAAAVLERLNLEIEVTERAVRSVPEHEMFDEIAMIERETVRVEGINVFRMGQLLANQSEQTSMDMALRLFCVERQKVRVKDFLR